MESKRKRQKEEGKVKSVNVAFPKHKIEKSI